jgi:hypothetical protein
MVVCARALWGKKRGEGKGGGGGGSGEVGGGDWPGPGGRAVSGRSPRHAAGEGPRGA